LSIEHSAFCILHSALSIVHFSLSISHCPFLYLCYNFAVSTQPVKQKTRAQIVVRGIVQGVNYRWFTQRRAAELHLTGYVMNMPDGSVLVVAEGARDEIEILLDALRVGPSAAVVESVQVEWHAPSGEFDRFEVRY
jgi:acylphosphatase